MFSSRPWQSAPSLLESALWEKWPGLEKLVESSLPESAAPGIPEAVQPPI